MKTWKHETWNRPLAIFKKHASECLFWTFDARDFCPPAVLRRTLTPWIRTPPVIRIYYCQEFASLQENWWSWIGGSKLSIFPPSALLSVKFDFNWNYNYYVQLQLQLPRPTAEKAVDLGRCSCSCTCTCNCNDYIKNTSMLSSWSQTLPRHQIVPKRGGFMVEYSSEGFYGKGRYFAERTAYSLVARKPKFVGHVSE